MLTKHPFPMEHDIARKVVNLGLNNGDEGSRNDRYLEVSSSTQKKESEK